MRADLVMRLQRMAKTTDDEKDREAMTLGAVALRATQPDELALAVLLDLLMQWPQGSALPPPDYMDCLAAAVRRINAST